MVPLIADENFPRQVVVALRDIGFDVLTCSEAGLAGRGVPDDEILAFATADGRAILTLNRRDFFRLRRDNSSHAGIVACTFDPDFRDQAGRIASALSGFTRAQLLRVNRPDR